MSKLIKEMKNGEVGYTVSWCIIVHDGKLLAFQEYSVEDDRRGTKNLRIKKESDSIVIFDTPEAKALVNHLYHSEPSKAVLSFTTRKYPHTGAVDEDYVSAKFLTQL